MLTLLDFGWSKGVKHETCGYFLGVSLQRISSVDYFSNLYFSMHCNISQILERQKSFLSKTKTESRATVLILQ